jgi:hypothetical protein
LFALELEDDRRLLMTENDASGKRDRTGCDSEYVAEFAKEG